MSLSGVRSLLLDLDGCVWYGNELAPGAAAFVRDARAAGLRLGFLTNISSGAGAAVATKLTRLGIPAEPLDVFAPLDALAEHPLMRDHPPTYVLGTRQVAAAVARLTHETSDPNEATLVVLSRDAQLTYERLAEAVHVLHRGGKLLALNLDARVPVAAGRVVPGNGAIAAALTTASGVAAECVGKPAARFFVAAMERLGMEPATTIMVGDNLDSDIAGGNAAGLRTVHVGGDTFSAHPQPPTPTVSVMGLPDLALLLQLEAVEAQA